MGNRTFIRTSNPEADNRKTTTMERQDLSTSAASSSPMTAEDAAALKEKFQQMYMELIATGLTPNDAVAEALTRLYATTASTANTGSSAAPPTQPPTLQAAPVITTVQPPPAPPLPVVAATPVPVVAVAPSPVGVVAVPTTAPSAALVPPTRPPALTLALLQSNDLSLSNMQTLVYETFSHSDHLNVSCFPGHSRHDIQQGLALLASHPVLANTMSNALQSWVNQPWSNSKKWTQPTDLHQFWVVLEHPLLFDPEYRQVVGGMAKLMYFLDDGMKAAVLARWAGYSEVDLHRLLDVFHQFITLALVGAELKMDMLFAVCDLLRLLHEINEKSRKFCEFSAFYNDAVNSELNLLTDYANSGVFLKHRPTTHQTTRQLSELSFCDFPFILDPASKSLVLHFDAEYQQRRTIIIRQLLDPDFGMFLSDEDTHTLWFNCDSLESSMEFELIGILLGLAIYNGVILDLHFPPLVYKKLMEQSVTLSDVEASQPALGRGLRQLLSFDGDVESVFQRSFQVSYQVFGEIKTVDLVPNGSQINVTNLNREEYVAKYVQYVTTDSVERQYGAFHRGFHLVCGGHALALFRCEELELLLCGSPDLDFEALEYVTQYDSGFSEHSDVIKSFKFWIKNKEAYFWTVVHGFTVDEKKQLLKFCTGSDRVPIRGLSEMAFVISRNGPDSNK
ncbi:hypothetical protein DYB28_000622 [Aphanomyces astaci]|uniref:HECT-type E3 ubiquitin transferase n=2 Tax=Aphanomyces astaci TaxID=112090 RepID=A0A9X8DW18_APHAT|nr:hypothetical protein DYB28_000622 [Aphanomyces astaci]